MKYYFSILILFFSLPVLLNSQSIITGKLIDSQNNEALIQATVSVDGTDIGTATDIEGKYQLSLNAGKYTLQFRYVGYQPESKEIEIDGMFRTKNCVWYDETCADVREVYYKFLEKRILTINACVKDFRQLEWHQGFLH